MWGRRERLMYSTYSRLGTRDSFYIFGLKVWDESLNTFMCPKCGEVKKGDIKHGAIYSCPKCSLQMQRWGNCLEIWR